MELIIKLSRSVFGNDEIPMFFVGSLFPLQNKNPHICEGFLFCGD